MILTLAATAAFSTACGIWAAEDPNPQTNAPVENPNEVPAYPDAQTALAEGNKFFEENKIEQAIDAFKQAVKMNPDLGDAHFKLGLSYALIESEQELVETPVEPVEDNKEGTNKKGETKEKKPNSTIAFENAVTAYKKTIKDDPENDNAYFNLGRVLNRLNDDKESRKALEKAVKLNPDDTQYQTELGVILIKLAQYDEAVRALKKAIELDEANAQAEELLVKAEAGKKRVDFGAEKLKDQFKNNQTPQPGRSGNKKEEEDEKEPEKPAPGNKKEPEKTKEPEKKKSAAVSNSGN